MQEPLQANQSSSMEHGISNATTKSAWREEDASPFSLPGNGFQMMDHGMTQNWLSDIDVSWDAIVTNGHPWISTHTTTSLDYHDAVIGHEDVLCSSFEHQYHGNHASHFSSNRGQYSPVKTSYNPVHERVIQHHPHDVNYGDMFIPQTIQYAQYASYEEFDRDNQTSSSGTQQSPQQPLFPENQFVDLIVPKRESRSQTPKWSVSVPSSEPPQDAFVFVNSFTDSDFSQAPTSTLTLDWSPTTAEEQARPSNLDIPYRTPVTKRKVESPPARSSKSTRSHQHLSDFVVVFETAPGALASVKKRKKLEAPVRKAAKDVRRAGACHQCRFRKRTCSTGTPCGTCLRQTGGLHELRCQRESPFLSRMIHQYFKYSSNRRNLSFSMDPSILSSLGSPKIVTLDGNGTKNASLPIQFRARLALLSSLSPDVQNAIKQTEDPREHETDDDLSKIQVMILEETETMGEEIEQWAMEYTSIFIHRAGSKFHPTTIAHILATAYVKKNLSESALLASMLRASSLAFVLRAGLKYHPSSTSPEPNLRYRTVQARIDSILYERMQRAEIDLFQRLQAIIFRTAGCLNKHQVYPVALVMWQLMRFLGISASHLGNIVQRFQSKASGPASYQLHGFQLLISTHLALFRSSNPLLLDFSDKFSAEMLGGDKELIRLAGLMKKVVLNFRQRGFPDLKGSIGFRKEFFQMSRHCYAL